MIELLGMFSRGISFAAIISCVGGPIFFLAVLRPAVAASGAETLIPAAKVIARVGWGSSWLLGVAALGTALLVTASVSDSRALLDLPLSLDVLFSSSYGNALLARIGLAVGMAGLYAMILKSPAWNLLWWSAAAVGPFLRACA
ncbi:MAG TPA: hypothetical protein VNL14_03905 [Candidatus Acidoferrales bacterium]|nr:hypothetical protein [Candidatus Acidoferrales bacterium]